ncbi:MAG: hypothetical protein WBA87_08455 [Microbacterium sp.]
MLLVVDVFRALGRRWYVTVVGVLLTAGLTVGAFAVTPPEYNARALIMLLPSQSAVGEGGNPFLTLGGLEQPAGILVAYFSSAPARAQVEAQSPTAEYTVAIDDSTRGPVIAIDVTDTTQKSALDILSFIADSIPSELERLQDEVDAPAKAVITSMPLTVDNKAEMSSANMIRMMIAALVVGLVTTLIVAFAVDGLILRRRLRREGIRRTSGEAQLQNTSPEGTRSRTADRAGRKD